MHKTISIENEPAFSMQNQDDIVNENVSGYAEFSNNIQEMGSKDSPSEKEYIPNKLEETPDQAL